MTIYTVPILAGNGYRLFGEIDTPTLWRITWHETTDLSNIARTVYITINEE